MTIAEAKRELIERFHAAGIDSPEADAEWLLSTLINSSRAELPIYQSQTLTTHQESLLTAQVVRRTNREPLQHILGTANFFGHDFEVSPDVLIPRPETEQLVELACRKIGDIPEPVIYDLGTGSGCIAITLAKRLPGATVIASDVSEPALGLAKRNAARLGVEANVQFRQANGHALTTEEQVHLLVSNPPYIPTAEIDELQPEVREFDPKLALDGGIDGLVFYRELAALGQALLLPGGALLAEFGDGQGAVIEKLFRNAAWPSVDFANDLSGKPRIVIASKGL
tara:strand:- start:169 stop:1017 length:849 start_codon:yes stop_codon:yes gene_type:complete